MAPVIGKPNCTVITHPLVLRLITERTCIMSMEIVYRDRVLRTEAALEVVMSLGAIHTPKALMQCYPVLEYRSYNTCLAWDELSGPLRDLWVHLGVPSA